jgi:glycosyltransferase involved in cell wall biosynthesis
MRKKVLLLTYGSRDHASSRIRGIQHFERLKGVFELIWIPSRGVQSGNSFTAKLTEAVIKRLNFCRQLLAILFGRFDFIFIQIVFFPEYVLRLMKAKRTVICYDFDDAVYTYSVKKFELTMAYANKVVVASPFLEDYVEAYHKNCKLIYSPVDTEVIVPGRSADPTFTIGWIGSPWTEHYLLMLKDVFEKLAAKISFKLIIVGAEVKMSGINTTCLSWSEQNELNALQQIDVGIMPLLDDEFSKMKGGYKLHLYMAAGKAVIASPVGINSLIVQDNVNGYLAKTEDDWLNAFERLGCDKNLREKMGANARGQAVEFYSYSVCTKQLYEYLIN